MFHLLKRVSIFKKIGCGFFLETPYFIDSILIYLNYLVHVIDYVVF